MVELFTEVVVAALVSLVIVSIIETLTHRGRSELDCRRCGGVEFVWAPRVGDRGDRFERTCTRCGGVQGLDAGR